MSTGRAALHRRLAALLWLLGSGLAHAGEIPAFPQLTEALSRAGLLGAQLSVRQAARQGRASAAFAECVNGITPAALAPAFETIVIRNLTPAEIAATETFFGTDAGRKALTLSLLQIYAALGEIPPEPEPVFSDEELAEIDAFSETPAGDKIMSQKLMQFPGARDTVTDRVKALFSACPP